MYTVISVQGLSGYKVQLWNLAQKWKNPQIRHSCVQLLQGVTLGGVSRWAKPHGCMCQIQRATRWESEHIHWICQSQKVWTDPNIQALFGFFFYRQTANLIHICCRAWYWDEVETEGAIHFVLVAYNVNANFVFSFVSSTFGQMLICTDSMTTW